MMQHNSRIKDVEIILDQLNILYEKEKTFDNLKYKNKLRFDYYLPKYNLCIEFNGAQHYEYVEYFHKDENEFNEQKLKDYIKSEYCRAHGIHLIELPCSLTSEEIRAELVQFINEHGDKEYDLLPEIESFLKLNESREVYINQLYKTYQKMLNQLSINDISNYKMFYDYVIDYWNLKDKEIVMVNNNFYERWINENIEYNNQQMLNSNNIIVQYIDELKDLGILNYSHLPSLILYNYFKQWLKDTNPGSHPMKLIDFTKRFKAAIKNENYTSHKRMRLSQLTKDQFDINIFDNLYIEESAKTAVFINPNLDIETSPNVNEYTKFFKWIKDTSLITLDYIPNTVLYALYLDINNKSSFDNSVINSVKLISILKPYMKKLGYIQSREKARRPKSCLKNINITDNISNYPNYEQVMIKNVPSQCWIKKIDVD